MRGTEERRRFAEILNRAHLIVRHAGIDEQVLDAYWMYLRRFSLAEVAAGIKAALEKKPEFFPTAPAIESSITGDIRARAMSACEEIVRAIERGDILKDGYHPLKSQMSISVDTSRLSPDALRDLCLSKCPPPNRIADLPFWKTRFTGIYRMTYESERVKSYIAQISASGIGLLTRDGES